MTQSALLNMETIEELKGVLGDNVTTLYAKFLNNSDNRLVELNKLNASNDTHAFKELAHTIKGETSNIGLAKIANLLSELESQILADPDADKSEKIHQIQSAYGETIESLKSHGLV
ncbi:MAG: Hpt domain-containing protein [Gammaproteobacteria bacterium]|nr:Hpt domain-containing protein [Gammaproteobacteria bacterium]MDH5629097.1 Hpt domain-containing protein [Gammaproteobacteria bacterium]